MLRLLVLHGRSLQLPLPIACRTSVRVSGCFRRPLAMSAKRSTKLAVEPAQQAWQLRHTPAFTPGSVTRPKTTFLRKRICLALRIRLPRLLLLAAHRRKRHQQSCSNSHRRWRLVFCKAMNSVRWQRPRLNILINWRWRWASRESSLKRWLATGN